MRLYLQIFYGVLRNTHVWKGIGIGHSRLSKVVDFGTNRKRVYNFLLVISSNFVPILPRFRDIAGFLLKTAIPPLFHPNFVGVPLGLDCRCWDSKERRSQANYPCNYFRSNATYMTTLPQRYRRTDGRLTIAIPHYAHSASRGKNVKCDPM